MSDAREPGANAPGESEAEDFEAEDGPIILPADASCAKCHYSAQIRQDGQIRSVRICRRFPPSSIFVPNAQGGVVTSQPAMVPDDYSCFEYDPRAAPVLIPTGLG